MNRGQLTRKAKNLNTIDKYLIKSKQGTVLLAYDLHFLYQLIDQVYGYQTIFTGFNTIRTEKIENSPYIFGIADIISRGPLLGFEINMFQQFRTNVFYFNSLESYKDRVIRLFEYLANYLTNVGILIKYSKYEGIQSIELNLPILTKRGIVNKKSDGSINCGIIDDVTSIRNVSKNNYMKIKTELIDKPSVHDIDGNVFSYHSSGVSDMFVVSTDENGLKVYMNDAFKYPEVRNTFLITAGINIQNTVYSNLIQYDYVTENSNRLPTLSQINPDISVEQLPALEDLHQYTQFYIVDNQNLPSINEKEMSEEEN